MAYTPEDKTCPTAEGASFTFRPAELGDGRTLVIHNTGGVPDENAPPTMEPDYQKAISIASFDENGTVRAATIVIGVADGPVGPCEVVDAPR